VLLSAIVATSVAAAVFMLGLAMDQRWLGLRLTTAPDLAIQVPFEGLWIEAAHPQGPAAALPGGVAALVAVRGSDGHRIALEPGDLLEEPDTLATYADIRAFFARQSRITQTLHNRPVTLETSFLSETQLYEVRPAAQRPLSSLPPAFWIQIGTGLVGVWIGAWVWSLRRGEWATRFLAIAGAGLMMSAFPAAVYSTRELALDGALFARLSMANHAGALMFGVGMIGLFLVYPRRLVAPRWLAAPPLILGLWLAVDLMQLAGGPAVGFHLAVVLAMASILALVAVQYRLSRGDPLARAALGWLGLSLAVGAGAFVMVVIAPNLLGLPPLASQGESFLLFLLVFVGVALGVVRYRLFQLGEWAFRVLFYVVGMMLLVALDALLIFTVVDDRAPAFALSLLIVALTWLPLRDALARLVLHRRETPRENLFRKVLDVALTPPGRNQHARWHLLLEEAFRPLAIMPVAGVAAPALLDNGLVMVVPDPVDATGLRLEHAASGQRLFSPRDAALAAELCAMLETALESRQAYEKGVAEERDRITRDIHDNIGVQLMGALHSPDATRKDLLIRETLTDLRDILNNASCPELSFDEMLADLRVQISEHLHTAGVQMGWQATSSGPAVLPLQTAHTLRSILRESVHNALKHAEATRIDIRIRHEGGALCAMIADDGKGFDTGHAAKGNGLINMRARVESLGGHVDITSDAQGTRIRAQIPILTGAAAA
jgi:two-component system, NarL family, sensor histidine kinase DevS